MSLNPQETALLEHLLKNVNDNLHQIEKIIRESKKGSSVTGNPTALNLSPEAWEERGQIIEGVFDGQGMVGADGKFYSMPLNYASKSKLVEGDMLKLTVTPDGTFLYKQTKPIERERVKGVLVQDKETKEFRVLVGDKLYKVLGASISFFRGNVGDEAFVLVPLGGQSRWAALENIVKAPLPQ